MQPHESSEASSLDRSRLSPSMIAAADFVPSVNKTSSNASLSSLALKAQPFVPGQQSQPIATKRYAVSHHLIYDLTELI